MKVDGSIDKRMSRRERGIIDKDCYEENKKKKRKKTMSRE